MRSYKILSLIILLLAIVSCESGSDAEKNLFSIQLKNGKNVYSDSDTILVSVISTKNLPVERVTYSIDGKEVISTNGSMETPVVLVGQKLGKRSMEASIISAGKTYTDSNTITLLSSLKPKIYTYRILEDYPHDINAYTQGLEFFNDTLYESTGQYKHSSLRKTVYTSGEIRKNIPLADQYFGEGITIINDKIFQLTWREKTGFIYDLQTMEPKGTFVYGNSAEGWGLCNNGSTIFKSDGSEKIWSLNSETLAEEGAIEIYTNTSRIKSVNELEWVEGKIFANIYERDAIAIVDPATGAVEGVINLKGLKDEVTQHKSLNVLNGIAYKGEPNIIYVTGKHWDKLFKIEIIEK